MTTPNATATNPPAAPLFDRTMLLVCVAESTGYAASAFLAPLLPLYLISQGHAESFIGLVLGAFNVASFFSRPIWGAFCDRGFLRASLTGSGLLVGTAYLGYLVPSAWFVFVVRAVQGIGWGGVNVVGSAWMAILAPAHRRAEALGWYTMAQRCGTAVGPVTALWALDHLGFGPAFIMGACAAYSVAAAAFFTKSHTSRIDRGPAPKSSFLASIIEPGALLGATLVVLLCCTGPALNAYMPLYFRKLGIEHVEFYYVAYGLIGIACRPLIGLFADRIGRLRAITIGFGLQVVGLALLGQSGEFFGIVAGMMVHTVGYAISEPSLYALAIDNTAAHRRGAAMATYTMAFQFGGGIGATVIGSMFEFIGYREAYSLLLLPACVALVVLAGLHLRERRGAAAAP